LETVSGGTLNISGDMSGTGHVVTVVGSGTVVLAGDNDGSGGVGGIGNDTGGFDIQGGTLKFYDDGKLGVDPSGPVADYIKLDNWATLHAAGTFTLNHKKGIELQSGNGKIEVDDGEVFSFNGDITGGNQFAKTGLGTFKMQGSCDMVASAIYIDAGTLWAVNTQPFDGTATTVYLGAESGADPATLKLGSGSEAGNIGEGITVRAGSSGAKTLMLETTATYVNIGGQVVLHDELNVITATNSAILDFDGGLDMSGTGNQDLTITGSGDIRINGAITADTGAAEINHNGTGTLSINKDNSVGNLMMINIGNTGTVELKNSNALGSDPSSLYPDKVNFKASGTLSSTVNVVLTNNVGMTISNGVTATFEVAGSKTVTLRGVLSDGTSNDGQLLKKGLGTLYFRDATNTYGGTTTIEEGTLRFRNDRAFGSVPGTPTPGNVVINGGILRSGAGATLDANRGISLGTNNATFYFDNLVIIKGIIAGAGTLTKTGSNQLRMEGENTYTNKTIIADGNIRITADSGLGTPPSSPTPGHLTLDGADDATLYAYDSFTLSANRGIQLGAAGGIIQVRDNKTMDYAGIIAGSGCLTKDGAGTLLLTGSNIYSGGTIVSNGILEGTTASLQGNIVVNLDKIIQFSQTTDGTYAGNISGGGLLQKYDSGSVTLSGTLSYSGPTRIYGGTLILDGTHTGAGTYNAISGNLGGSGSTDGIVQIRSGNSIRGGTAGSPGVLNTGNLAMYSGATFTAELAGATAGTQYSQVESSTVNLNADSGSGSVLDITLSYAPAPRDKFVLINNSGGGSVNGAFSGLAEGATVYASYNGISYPFIIHYAGESSTGARTGGNDVLLMEDSPMPTVFLYK
jgi:autotransporter-associated beta strand protein